MTATTEQLDTLQELINIGVGRSASILNDMISAHIQLQVPYLKLLSILEVEQELEKQLGQDHISAVRLGFNGFLAGIAQLVFPTDSALNLVVALTDEELDLADFNSVKIGTLSEVGNIVLNGVMGSLSNMLSQHLRYSLPIYLEDSVTNLLTAPDFEVENSTVLLAQAHFNIQKLLVAGDIILIFKVGSFNSLLRVLDLSTETWI